MNEFLTTNEWPWRLARTIVQGALGVLAANVDMLCGLCGARTCVARDRGRVRDGGALADHGRTRRPRRAA